MKTIHRFLFTLLLLFTSIAAVRAQNSTTVLSSTTSPSTSLTTTVTMARFQPAQDLPSTGATPTSVTIQVYTWTTVTAANGTVVSGPTFSATPLTVTVTGTQLQQLLAILAAATAPSGS